MWCRRLGWEVCDSSRQGSLESLAAEIWRWFAEINAVVVLNANRGSGAKRSGLRH